MVELFAVFDGVDGIDAVEVQMTGERVHVAADDGGVQLATEFVGEIATG